MAKHTLGARGGGKVESNAWETAGTVRRFQALLMVSGKHA